MGVYQEKAVVSGSIIEFFFYEKLIYYGYQDYRKRGSPTRAGPDDEKVKGPNRERSLSRAKRRCTRLINSNVERYFDSQGNICSPKFLTLTFAENIVDLKQANYEWKKFRQRLEDWLNQKLKYVTAVEFQKRGAVHYHSVIFNLYYIPKKKLSQIWGNGFVKINKIDHVDNLGAYMSKYMNKAIADQRLDGEKCYFTSRGLYEPEEIKDKGQVDALLASLPDQAKVLEKTFQAPEIGSITYLQYNVKRYTNQ